MASTGFPREVGRALLSRLMSRAAVSLFHSSSDVERWWVKRARFLARRLHPLVGGWPHYKVFAVTIESEISTLNPGVTFFEYDESI